MNIALGRRADTREVVLALGLPTALFLSASLAWLIRARGVALTDARLLSTLAIEAALALMLVPYLRRRGWRPETVAGAPSPNDVLVGAAVWFAAMLAVYAVFVGVYLVAPAAADALRSPRITGAVSRPMMVGGALLNPIFEEFLWLGYAVPALGSRVGLRWAGAISVALRVAIHAYQGPLALVSILPLALVFTTYFVRSGRLWPVVVAHVIADALALGVFTARS